MTIKQAQSRLVCIGAAFVVSGALGVLGWYAGSLAAATAASAVFLLTLAYVALDAIARAAELDDATRPVRHRPIDISRYRREELQQLLAQRDRQTDEKDGAA